ncbi:MAG: twin-arginine translocation signal domain-containing protein [Bacteroidia bacterium]|nr:twin-arginine translocation signal domain-containing protein [Bacteroidia bacterium]
MESTSISRRKFVKGLAGGAAGVAVLGSYPGMSAISYSRIIGANERINLGVIGCGGMAGSHMEALLALLKIIRTS